MSKRKKSANVGTMLDLWRPPQGAGDPLGCLATTYTFAPALFDEQCLARFLEIGSEPNREDLAFLLERENRLGEVYAGVLVDHTQAGVEHSLRWDVLPVRLGTGKQHAKLSLLVWYRHIRIIVASANLTEPGYRANREVATCVELTPEECDAEMLTEAVHFLSGLITFVPGASTQPPEVRRAEAFLDEVVRHAAEWKPSRRKNAVRQQLVATLPPVGDDHPARSSLDEAISACRRRGGSPHEAWIASPFFDIDEETSRVTASLCKLLARGGERKICFCVPAVRSDGDATRVPRLAAPMALIRTPPLYHTTTMVEMLPELDEDKNRRPWHAKMFALLAGQYSALMVGSSNFTCAGLGISRYRNAEANLLTIVDRVAFGRETGNLEAVWPVMEQVADPELAEWLGPQADQEEEAQAAGWPLPAGFLAATYSAGGSPQIVLRIDPNHLPEDWSVRAFGQDEQELLSAATWMEDGCKSSIELAWTWAQAPTRLLILWADHEAFMPVNVENTKDLPPPAGLERMSADDMLLILAAADPGAAFRVWARRQEPSEGFDADLDTATPVDLDPLRRYDLQATFLHRIRRRARILGQLRTNLQRPVWGRQALEWRLHGLVGIEPLAGRLVQECAGADDEALLTLADFLIVLREVDYQASDGSLTKSDFEGIFRPFLRDLADKVYQDAKVQRDRISEDLVQFWERVIEQCRK